MADSKKNAGSDRHKPSRMVRLPRALADLLEELGEEKLTDMTTEAKQAIREYLERLGRWPPKRRTKEH